jgi:hypothetical protein
MIFINKKGTFILFLTIQEAPSRETIPFKSMFSVWLQTEDASPRVRLPLPLLHPEQQLRRGDRLHLVLTPIARHTI